MKGDSIRVGSWDKGIAYDDLKRKIITLYNELSNRDTKTNWKRISYLTVYAIQLRNALRISEALESFLRFAFEVYPNNAKSKKRKIETEVLVAKKKYVSYDKKKNEWKWKKLDFRRVIFPSWFPNERMSFKTFMGKLLEKSYIVEMYKPVYNDWMDYIKELEEVIRNKEERIPEKPESFERLVKNLKKRCEKLLGVNTHTLRYAYITYLLEKGYSPSLIAKITHHSNLNFILKYTQQKQAERILENIE